MRIEVVPVSSHQKKVQVQVPAADVDKELNEAYRTLRQRVRLKGFRPGKAPRKVLELHYVHGRSYREIARITRAPMGTVMSRLHRARRALRDGLRDYADRQGIGTAPRLAA